MDIQEEIAEAAIRYKGQIFTGRKHYMIMQKYYRETGDMIGGEEGFVTDTGRFVSRTEAARIAFAAGQIKLPKAELTSDDLY